jgi:TolB protein
VFVSYRDGNGELYAVPLAGGEATRLTATAAAEADPALSPDGHLAYTRSDGGVAKLWLATANGSSAARATAGFGFGGSIEAGPFWAPGGDRVVFVSTSAGSADLFTYHRAAGTFSALVPDSASRAEVEPVWSPDGKWIAFATDRPGDTEIYRVDVATGALERLTRRSGTDAQPAWTADGRLVFLAWMDGVPRLQWLDPLVPGTVVTIDVGPGTPGRPGGVW